METAKLFINGRSQAVRLPKSCRFNGTTVFVNKIDDVVILLPKKNSWETLFKSLDKFSDDFMENRAQPKCETRESIE